MFSMFMEALKPDESMLVLDIGVTPDTSLPDSNFFERYYPYPDRLATTSIEDASNLLSEFPGITFVRTEKSLLPFKDKAFDIVFCAAVLEHVGDRASQESFVKEMLRVSKKFFITTPNKAFPIEVHTFLPFIHWLPQNLHQGILRFLGMKFWSKTENLNLLSEKSLLKFFAGLEHIHIKKNYLLGLPSNLIIYGESG